MTTDFRALCEELANRMDSETGYTSPDGTRFSHPAVVRARAASRQLMAPRLVHAQLALIDGELTEGQRAGGGRRAAGP
jgi:hypothetical protein